MPWEYSQRTGELRHDGELVDTGYSGSGTGRNNPDLQNVRNVGPIPRGRYTIGRPHASQRTGPHVMDLTPDGHNALGRDNFQIHGDNRTNDASTGCIIMNRTTRERISNSGDNVVVVVD